MPLGRNSELADVLSRRRVSSCKIHSVAFTVKFLNAMTITGTTKLLDSCGRIELNSKIVSVTNCTLNQPTAIDTQVKTGVPSH